MGDVAMLLPILYGVAIANPECEFTLLTQPFLANLLVAPPNNLEAMTIDPKGEEQHIGGLLRYVNRIIDERFDLYIDAHDVLRTKVLRWGIALRGIPTLGIRKPRKARRRLLRRSRGLLEYVTPMVELYKDLFKRAGLRIPEKFSTLSLEGQPINPGLFKEYPEAFDPNTKVIGVAPFASTTSKAYDLEQLQQVIATLSEDGHVIYLFGGRGKEAQALKQWTVQYPNVRSLAGKHDISDELSIIARLHIMLSMDSANMHLASMLGVRVISIWCATHPAAGFLGIGQSPNDCLQDDSLTCRPCSIFGKVKSCKLGGFPCRSSLSPEQIITHVRSAL